METDEPFFHLQLKHNLAVGNALTNVVYQDSDNWLKASIEYENDVFQRLGSVVTNYGYSDWATTDISAEIHSMYYRLSRRNSDYCDLLLASTTFLNHKL